MGTGLVGYAIASGAPLDPPIEETDDVSPFAASAFLGRLPCFAVVGEKRGDPCATWRSRGSQKASRSAGGHEDRRVEIDSVPRNV
jgi:hypothetical protein